jgi:hypothetical protein
MRRILFAAILALWSPALWAQTPTGATVSNPTNLPPTKAVTATIANGAALSGAVDLGQNRLFAVQMPTTWTAAGLTFQASSDGITYFNVFDDSSVPGTFIETTWTAAASQYQVVASPAKWIGIRWLKIRSGTAGVPVNQGGARTLTVIGVPF